MGEKRGKTNLGETRRFARAEGRWAGERLREKNSFVAARTKIFGCLEKEWHESVSTRIASPSELCKALGCEEKNTREVQRSGGLDGSLAGRAMLTSNAHRRCPDKALRFDLERGGNAAGMILRA